MLGSLANHGNFKAVITALYHIFFVD